MIKKITENEREFLKTFNKDIRIITPYSKPLVKIFRFEDSGNYYIMSFIFGESENKNYAFEFKDGHEKRNCNEGRGSKLSVTLEEDIKKYESFLKRFTDSELILKFRDSERYSPPVTAVTITYPGHYYYAAGLYDLNGQKIQNIVKRTFCDMSLKEISQTLREEDFDCKIRDPLSESRWNKGFQSLDISDFYSS